MQITLTNVRQWAKDSGYEPRFMMGARTIRAHIHDEAFTCIDCGDAFTARTDLDEDHACFACEGDYRRDWGGFNPRREYGTI